MQQLRIATIGDYSKYFSYFLYGTMEGAIRNGAWFRPIQLLNVPLKDVEEQINFFKPHILFSHCIFNRKPREWREDVFRILRSARERWNTFVCYHMGDARSEPRYPHDISEFVDAVLINNGEGDLWTDEWWKVPCYHWPYSALYQENIADINPEFRTQIVFTGRLTTSEDQHHKDRTDFIGKLKKKMIVKVYPDAKWGNSRFLTAEVASSADCILGTQMGGDVYLYNDVRPFQYIGAGALYFHDKHPNMSAFFEDGIHYLSYTSVDDLLDKYEEYVKNDPKKSKKIRRLGFNFCQEHHSTKKRVQFVIDIWKGKEIKPNVTLEDINASIN
jgi:hypothetical protein